MAMGGDGRGFAFSGVFPSLALSSPWQIHTRNDVLVVRFDAIHHPCHVWRIFFFFFARGREISVLRGRMRIGGLVLFPRRCTVNKSFCVAGWFRICTQRQCCVIPIYVI